MGNRVSSEIKKITLDNLLPAHSISCVIIGFEDGELKVLLIKWKETDIWALPGGFIGKEENLNDAGIRVLRERTKLELPF